MLDEPLGALDRTIRERLVGDLRQILKEARQTALYVTHDQEEAFRVSDRVVILGDGKAAQMGTPQEIYYHPASPYIAKFLGMDNFFQAEILQTQQGSVIKTSLGEWQTNKDWQGKGLVLLRPDRIFLNDQGSENLSSLEGILQSSRFSGSALQIELDLGQNLIQFSSSDSDIDLPDAGERIKVWFDPDQAAHFFPD